MYVNQMPNAIEREDDWLNEFNMGCTAALLQVNMNVNQVANSIGRRDNYAI